MPQQKQTDEKPKSMTNNIHGNFTPLLGHCLVKLEPQVQEREGGIFMPEVARQEQGFVGECLAENPGHRDPRGLVGQRLILGVTRGRLFKIGEAEYQTFPIRSILAIVEPGIDIRVNRAGPYGIRRCRFCKSKGPANIFLDGDGICTRCGRDDHTGKKHVPREPSMSDELTEALGWPVKREATSKVYSFPGLQPG